MKLTQSLWCTAYDLSTLNIMPTCGIFKTNIFFNYSNIMKLCMKKVEFWTTQFWSCFNLQKGWLMYRHPCSSICCNNKIFSRNHHQGKSYREAKSFLMFKKASNQMCYRILELLKWLKVSLNKSLRLTSARFSPRSKPFSILMKTQTKFTTD